MDLTLPKAFGEKRQLWLLIALYFSLRLIFLTRLPVFNDEAIYLDWAWRQLHLPGQLFFSLHDGKPPLLLWIFGIFAEIIPDPLLAGRLVSVLAGGLTLGGIYLVAKKFFEPKIAVWASLLYIVIPIFSFFDRQALMEAGLATIDLWLLYFLLSLIQKPEKRTAIFLGVILALGIFIKTSAFLFTVSFILILVWQLKSPAFQKRQQIGKNLSLILATTLIVLTPLWLQKAFWWGLSGNSRYTLTFSELGQVPLTTWFKNGRDLLELLFWQLTPLVFGLGLLGLVGVFKSKNQGQKLIGFWLTSQLLFLVILARQLSPRYLVSFLAPWLVLASFGLERTFNFRWRWLVLALTLVLPIYLTGLQIFSPLNYFAILSRFTQFSQKQAYVTGWPSGYGINEVRQFLEEKARLNPLIVGVRLDSGNPENAILAYYHRNQQIQSIYFDSRLWPNLSQVDCLKMKQPFYFVSRDRQLGGMERFLQEEARFYKSGGESSIGIYSLKPCNQEGRPLIL